MSVDTLPISACLLTDILVCPHNPFHHQLCWQCFCPPVLNTTSINNQSSICPIISLLVGKFTSTYTRWHKYVHPPWFAGPHYPMPESYLQCFPSVGTKNSQWHNSWIPCCSKKAAQGLSTCALHFCSSTLWSTHQDMFETDSFRFVCWKWAQEEINEIQSPTQLQQALCTWY